MSAQREFADRNYITLNLQCHWCGHRGLTLWERTDAGLEFLTIEGFYERIAKKRPFRMETVCNACNKAQPV